MIFWDASALIRAFVASEPGHGQATSLLTRKGQHAASILLPAEATSALLRRSGRKGVFPAAFLVDLEQTLGALYLVEIQREASDLARQLVKEHRLRGADSIHLACALLTARQTGRDSLRFATSDAEQAEAARASGLRVITPGL